MVQERGSRVIDWDIEAGVRRMGRGGSSRRLEVPEGLSVA